MSMDKGAFIENGYSVEPGDGGSFIITEGGHRFGNSEEGKWRLRAWRGFTRYEDMLAWLAGEHNVNAHRDDDAKQRPTLTNGE